jgi:hypothetical protein
MKFIQHDAVCRRHWSALTGHFAEFQPVLCDRRRRIVAGGYTIPFAWNGQRRALPMGVDGVLVRGVDDRQHGRAPTAVRAPGRRRSTPAGPGARAGWSSGPWRR